MSQITSIPIHDTAANILSKDSQTNEFNTYPFVEGQTFFATDTKKFFKDKGGQRTIQINFESIEAYDGTVEEFYERGTQGFEGEIVVARSEKGFRMYYVDTTGELHNLSYSPDEVINIAQSGGLPEGFSSIVLRFFKLTDIDFADPQQVESLTPPTVSGTIDFEAEEDNVNITSIQPNVWVENVSDLDGNWTYDSSENMWLFNAAELPETINPQNAKIAFSQILLFSDSGFYEFQNRVGDVPSKWREDGANQANLFLYRATSTETPPTDLAPGELFYTFPQSGVETFSGDKKGWLTEAPSISATNRFIWAIGTTVASNITAAIIPSNTWTPPKIIATFSEDGLNIANINLYRRASTQPPTPTISGTYNFVTGSWAGLNISDSFTLSIPVSSLPLWTSTLRLSSREDSITVVNQSGTTPVKISENGVDGRRVVSAVLYFQTASENPPSINFTGISYTISTATFSPNPPSGWGPIPPVFLAGESNKYWYVNWSGQESSPNSNTITTFTNTSPVQAINFDGLVTFTDISGDKVVTTDDITSIQGGLLKTSVIESNATYFVGQTQTPRLTIDFNNGSLSAENFSIDSSGNASFAGTISSTSGDIGGWDLSTDALTRGDTNFSLQLGSTGLNISRIAAGVTEVEQRIQYGPGGIFFRDLGTSGLIKSRIERVKEDQFDAEPILRMTSENSIKIETLSANRNVTLKSAGSLVLDASGVNHTETTPQFLTISSAGVLGRSSGSGGGSGTPSLPFGSVQFNENGFFGGSPDLHWNDAQSRLGIGTNSPITRLEILGGSNLSLNRLAQIRSNFEGIGTSSILRLANSTSNNVIQGSVDLIGRRSTAGGASEFIVATNSSNDIFANRIKIDNVGLTLLGTSLIEKDSGNMGLLASNGNITLSPQSGGFVMVNGNLALGTQANKATITYTANTARTYTIPNAGSNASFVMTNGAQSISGLKTFNDTSGTTFVRTPSNDGITIQGSSTGNSERRITLTTASLGANRTITFPDATGTVALDTNVVTLTGNQTIQGTKTFRNSNGTRFEQNALNDSVVLQGRSGGTSSFAVTLRPTTLTQNSVITIPNSAGVLALTNGTLNLTGNQTAAGVKTFSNNLVINNTLSLRSSATTSAATQIPVFIEDPSSTTRLLVTRTPAQLASDMGISSSGFDNTQTLNLTPAPNEKIKLATANVDSFINLRESTTFGSWIGYKSGNGLWLGSGTDTSRTISFVSGEAGFGAGTPDMQIRNGNVGIGTTSPSAKLHVVGDLVVTGNIVGSFPLTGLVTVSFTLTEQDRNTMIRMNSPFDRTATIPANVFQAGDEVHFVRNNAGEVTISPGSGFTLNSEGGKRRIDTRYQVATVKFYSPTEALLFGALKT